MVYLVQALSSSTVASTKQIWVGISRLEADHMALRISPYGLHRPFKVLGLIGQILCLIHLFLLLAGMDQRAYHRQFLMLLQAVGATTATAMTRQAHIKAIMVLPMAGPTFPGLCAATVSHRSLWIMYQIYPTASQFSQFTSCRRRSTPCP